MCLWKHDQDVKTSVLLEAVSLKAGRTQDKRTREVSSESKNREPVASVTPVSPALVKQTGGDGDSQLRFEFEASLRRIHKALSPKTAF